MSHLPRHRLRHWALVAWLAVFALCVVPTLSRLVAQVQGGSPWQQICSAGSTTDADPSPNTGQIVDHCALCLLSGAAATPAPEAAPWHSGSALREHLAGPAKLPAALSARAWRAGQPRAPPAQA